MSIQIYINGKYYSKEEAKVSVFNHGFLYGDGVFEGIRAYNGSVFRLREHLDRLYDGINTLMLNVKETKLEMQEIILETLRRNNLKDAYIRAVVARGVGDLGLDPVYCSDPTVVVIADTIAIYPQEMYDNGLKIITAATRRNNPEGVNPQVKSLNYLNNIMAKMEANRAGALEAVLLNKEDYVAECTGDNIFIVKNGVLITPPTYAGILVGVTRNAVIELANEMGIPFKEKALYAP